MIEHIFIKAITEDIELLKQALQVPILRYIERGT